MIAEVDARAERYAWYEGVLDALNKYRRRVSPAQAQLKVEKKGVNMHCKC